MNVMLLTEVFPPKVGGSGRWFWEVYRRLPREEVVIAAGEALGQEAFDRSHDLRVVRMPLTLPSWGLLHPGAIRGHWRALPRLARLVRSERVSMVHCGKCLPEGLMALVLGTMTGIPYACYVHGEEMNLATQSRELGWLTRRVLGGASYLIANSRNTARILGDEWGVPPGRVVVLYPGVDTHSFAPAPRDPDARAALGWGDRPVILTVGRLQERKGHDRMISALGAIRHVIPDVLYAILGDGEQAGRLRDQVAEGGLQRHVQFLGDRDDESLIRCYQQCNLFVLPNRQVGRDIEGLGIVLLEAQACGKPVVAGDSGGTVETMQIPETGRVVPCDGAERLAAVVIELLGDPVRLAEMGEAARCWAVERFDWDIRGERSGALFRSGPGRDAARLRGPANLA